MDFSPYVKGDIGANRKRGRVCWVYNYECKVSKVRGFKSKV